MFRLESFYFVKRYRRYRSMFSFYFVKHLSNILLYVTALSHAYLSDRIYIKKIERRKAGYFLTADNALSRRAEVNYNFR